MDTQTPELNPDFFCVSNARWRQLQRSSLQAQSVNERLSLTLLALGHDLRQELHLLNAWLSPGSPARIFGPRDASERITKRIRRLTSKCEQATAIASLSNAHGKITAKSPVAIQPLLLDIYTQWQSAAKAKGLEFKLRAPNVMVSTNAFWLGVIASNLIGNAVQHTMNGGVAVDFSGGVNDWVLTVTDSGPGFAIVSSAAPDVGRHFHCARTTSLGIGLTLVKQAAALLDHSLTIATGASGSMIRLHISRGAAEGHQSARL